MHPCRWLSARLAICLIAAVALPGNSALAASVNPSGYNNDFTVQPPAEDWATISVAGAANDVYQMDADINANIAAAAVTAQTTANAAVPAQQMGVATWSSSDFYLQTRPTGNRYTVLIGKFVNNTGTNASEIRVAYLFTIAAGGVAEEADRGNRAYYSLTGLAGSWVNIPGLNTTSSTDGSTTASTTVSLNWPDGASLYVLWADDNASGQGTDAANQIDDFALHVTAGTPLSTALTATLTAPPNESVFVSGAAISATTSVALGTPPYSVEYFLSAGAGNTTFASVGSSSMAPFEVGLGNLAPGTYNVYGVATDTAAPPASTNTMTNTFFVADPLVVMLTSPPNGLTVDHMTSVTGAASVSGGTPPYSVQFYLDGLPQGPPATGSLYEHVFGALFVGDHGIYASATDSRGWMSNSPVHSVHVTGPLGVTLTPTNGASFVFGESVTLVAAPGGGTGPYTLTFYTNDVVAGSGTLSLDLGILAEGSYTSYVHAVDSTSAQADSTVNVFSVLPNPISITLTSPTNGQTGFPGSTLPLAATASVSAPLTITNIAFYYDGVLVGSDASAPYTASVPNAVQGVHTVYAVAMDSLGRQRFSPTNQVTISAPPGSNDNFADAIPLFGPVVTTTGNNSTATRQGGFQGEPFHGGNFGGASVWWTWTATASGPTTIDTLGSDFNTLLGVYTGNAVNQLTTIAGNNDFEGNQWSRVEFNAVAGTLYRIAVDGFSAGFPPNPARGNIVLNIKGVGGVEVTSPSNGAVFTVGEPIPVEVGITPDFPNPPATRVDFYIGGVQFGSSDTAPFTAVATNVPAGSNTIYAVGIDSTGRPIQSGTVRIFVQKIGVTILTPFEDTMFLSTNPITVTAWSYLPSGSITNIEFFVDGVKFGEDADQPFAAAWTDVTPGSHRFVAIGRSDAGVAYASQPVNFGVASVMVPFASVWKYLDNGSDQGSAWVTPEFDDSAWLSGPAPLGYSDSNGRFPATTNSFGPDAAAKYPTTYYRQSFVASNVASLSSVLLSIERDDGAIVYLNGAELARFNMPTGAVAYNQYSGTLANDDGGTIFNLNLDPGVLLEGMNTFAVSIHQDSGTSSDIWFQMRLMGLPVIIHNLSPLVSITTPTNNQYFLAPDSVTLEAEASDADGSVAKVEYFDDGILIGESTNAPYTVVWNAPSVRARKLTAVATDDLGATTISDEVPIVIYDAAGTPVAAITSVADGAVMEGPTNLLITATANAIDGVTNVQFLADGAEFGNDDSAPYSAVWTAPFGTTVLTVIASDVHGTRGASPPVHVTITIPPTNVIAPTILRQAPLAGSTVTNLTNITVSFSEYVQNVDASDLLINGVPAIAVNGNHSRSNYTFTFPHPPYGQVNITWASDHGITDYGWPTVLPFDETAEGASWSYDLIDRTPPAIAARSPAPNSLVTNLHEIMVTFSEPVSGVDAADLLVNGGASFEVSGSGTTYTFKVSQPASGTVNVSWATNADIFDLALTPNAFNRTAPGAAWSFTLDTRVVLAQSNSVWRFTKGTNEASDPIDAWRQLAYDDSSWSNAPAPFFFGDTYTNALIQGTLLSDMLNNYTTVFLRKEFQILKRGEITSLLLNAQSDDGFIAWINGVEVRRVNAPAGQPTYATAATANANEPNNNGAGYVVATLPAAAVNALVDGRNVLTVLAFNQSLANNDFGFNAQLYYFPLDAGTVPPRLLTPIPTPGDVLALTNITVTFSEPVSGVNASDLLVNGAPATAMETTTNTIYTFQFPQPPYGQVIITWDTNHGILDFDGPPRAFNASAVGSIFAYTLINPSNPKVLTQVPLAGSTVTGLTAIVVTFTEPVGGVDAADLLISNAPAASVTTDDNVSYTFQFPQPPFGSVPIRWTASPGIVDLEAGNAFDPVRFGAQWSYTLIDPVPSVTITSPTNGTYRLVPATVTVTATASDNDGTIAGVQFYEGAAFLREVTAAPYSVIVSNLPLGSYTFRAVATDNIGLMRTSAPVVLNVVTSLPASLVRGPYLQVGTPTSGLVRWRTDVPTEGLVYYGADPERLTNSATELSVTNEHIVQITGLEPSTRYYYSIGSAAQRLAGTNGVGSQYWFDTSPPVGTRKPIRLWVLGDAGTAGNGAPDRQQSTRNAFYNYVAATGQEPDIWLMLGDNAYNSGTDVEHQRAVFDMYPSTLRNKFLWPTLGNHETAMSRTTTDFPYLHIFSLPRNAEAGGVASGTEKYYSFDYGNIHFVSLDSMTSGQTGNTPMAEWLRQDLEATTAEWIIVFFHHPPYTKGSHDSDAEQDLVNIRQNLVPIMEANGVDLVLTGHSHCYERSYLLHGHYGMSTTLTEGMKIDGGDGRTDGDGPYEKNDQNQGVVYAVAGSSGQATFLSPGAPLPAHFITLLELGSMVIDVNENRLDAIFLRENGLIQDRFTLLKPDPRPATPLNLVALPSGPAEVTLEWADMAGNELGYSIERSLDGVNFAEYLTVGADTVSALDTGVVLNVAYYYRVRGTNEGFVSEYSNIAGITPVLAASAPQSPGNLLAISDDGIRFYRSQMILSWVDRSTDEAAFQIERSHDGLLFVPVGTVAANVTSYLDGGLESASHYFYRVRAINSAGGSASSNFAIDQTHPQSQLVRAGETVVFHAGIEGSPGLKYQWNFMGSPLPGETNQTLTIASAQLANDGEYTVTITSSRDPQTSNPATLAVVAPPRIVSHPADAVRGVGMSVEFAVTAEGTAPLRYRWRKNGGPIGLSAPTLNLTGLVLGDHGGYDVIVENNFGSVTSRVALLRVSSMPELTQAPDLIAEVLRPLRVTNVAIDANVPPLNLRYVLGLGAPTNAILNPFTGVFSWTPNRSQAPSENTITIIAFDNGYPFLTDSMSFNVRVLDYAELNMGAIVMLANTNATLPIRLFSSLPLADLQATINFPGSFFSDVSLIQTNGPESVATLDFQRLDSDNAALTISAANGGGLINSNDLGALRLVSRPLTNTAALPFRITALSATTVNTGDSATLLRGNGQVVVVGTRPLLDARLASTGVRELTLYARQGIYTVQYSTNLADPLWRTRANVSVNSNLSALIRPGTVPPTNMPSFFRARQ